MINRQMDPELLALMTALHDHCKSRNIELIAVARFLGDMKVFVAKVGSDEAATNLLDHVRNSLSTDDTDDEDDEEGSEVIHH